MLAKRTNRPIATPTVFDDLIDFMNIFETGFSPSRLSRRDFDMDVRETDDCLNITANLPGVQKEDVNVDIENDLLTISVHNEKKTEQEKGGYYLQERKSGQLSRTIRIPFDVDPDKIHCTLKDGVLDLKFEKEGRKRRRTIPIKD